MTYTLKYHLYLLQTNSRSKDNPNSQVMVTNEINVSPKLVATKTIHYYSGIIISVFVAVHLTNHLMLFQGEQAHIQFMATARKFYRNIFIETLLLTAVAVQGISGIVLVATKWNYRKTIFDKLHIYSGLYLAIFLTGHVLAVLAGRYVFKLDTNLYYGAGVLNNNPVYFFYFPYYALLIISFFTHIACVHKMRVASYVSERQAARHAIGIIILGVLTALFILYPMAQITIPPQYQIIPFGKYQ